MEDFKCISVTRTSTKELKINNPTHYPLIGKGEQGAVFKLSSKRCVKIYARQKQAEMEANVYKLTQDSPIIPKLYEIGSNYIIMEYIEGPTLEEYLKKKRKISKSLTSQILFMLKEMNHLGFTRLNVRLKHVIITKQEMLKVIDHVNSFTIKERRPIILFDKFEKLDLLHPFLKQVKKIDKEIYLEWKESMSEYFK
ncbi:MAG: hypothetical protein PWP27_491 [Clostridiales bacterium]|jgi:predicted Ser/Thr protein kinase|nr:hypothetical protein [Clostridiales bacterium]MDK2932681.1 hypothetical protein [Clostridiales bacterium]